MPDEFNRVRSRKRIYSPDDDGTFLDIPVIDRIAFRDQKSSAQDSVLLLNNTSESSRKTHIKKVENPATSDYINVERIDKIGFSDQKDSAQETVFRLLNDEPQHLKTHVVRYYKDNDQTQDVWLDSELIDEFYVTDQKDKAQPAHFVLKNDPIGAAVNDPDDPFSPTIGNVDLTLPLKDAGGGLDPPYRLDPFQNIVNVSMNLPPGNIMAVGTQYLENFAAAGIQLDRKSGAVVGTYDSSEYLVWFPDGTQTYPAGTNFGASIDPKGNVAIGSYSYGPNTDGDPGPDNTRGRNSSLQIYRGGFSPSWVGPLVGQSIVFDGAVGFDKNGSAYIAAGLGSAATGAAREDAIVSLTKFDFSDSGESWSTFLAAGGGVDAQVGTSGMMVLLDGTAIINYGTGTETTLSAFDGKTGAHKWSLSGDLYPANNVSFRRKAFLLSQSDPATVLRVNTNGEIDLSLSGSWTRALSADSGQDGKIYVLGTNDDFTAFSISKFSKAGQLLASTSLPFGGADDTILTGGITNIVAPGKDVVAVSFPLVVISEQTLTGLDSPFDIYSVYGFNTDTLSTAWETTYSALKLLDTGRGNPVKLAGAVYALGRGP